MSTLKTCGKCGRKIFTSSVSYERRLKSFQERFETKDNVCDECMKAIDEIAFRRAVMEKMRLGNF